MTLLKVKHLRKTTEFHILYDLSQKTCEIPTPL